MNEYNLPLGLDLEKMIRDAGRAKGILQDLNQTALNMGNNTQQTFNNAANAANNLGRNITQQATALNSTTKSIEQLKKALQTYKDQLTQATDTAAIRRYNVAIERLERQIRQTTNAGRQGFDEMGNRIQRTTNQTRGLVNGLNNIASALGIAFALTTVVQFGKELFSLGVKASGIERAFSRLGDSASMKKLRKETDGFVADLELEKLTVKANNFNIPIEKLGGFLAFASQRAAATGEDVNKLTNNIIDGLGRKSSRIIDNLGISIVDIQKEFKKTGDFTTAVSNLIEREMQSSGAYVDTLSDKVGRMSTNWANAKLAVAGFFARMFNPNIADNKIIGELTSKAQQQFGDLSNASSRALGILINNQEKLVQELSSKYTKVLNEYDGAFSTRGKRKIDDDRKAFGEQLVAAQNVLRNLKDQNMERAKAERTAKGILSVVEMEQKVTDLRATAKNIIPGIEGGNAEDRQKLLDEADALQLKIDEITGKAEKRRDKADEKAENKRLQRIQQLNAERVKLENDFYSSQIEAIEDATTKAVAAETVGSQNRVRELENRRTIFPELVKQINALIEEEESQSKSRVTAIIKKGEEDDLKARQSSQREIARVLKDDTDAQINAINERYDLIRQNAKKAGTMTTEVEKLLVIQQEKEVTDVKIKSMDESLQKQEDLALSGLYARKKRENQSEVSFERETQTEILKINIEFAKKRLALIATDPAKTEEVNKLMKAIKEAQDEVNAIGKDKKGDLFDYLGINGDKLMDYADAAAMAGQVTSDLFGGLAEAAQAKVDIIKEEIDAIDELINKQEEAVDREKDLMDKGYANNYENAQKTLQAQKAQRDELLKQQEEAQKRQQALQRVQIIADSVAQGSNLITASTDIFKVFSKIPIIGVPLAIAAIATMFGAFTVAKITAFNATKLADGGTAGGKLHSEGGNKYISMDGNDGGILEIEKGEEVIKRKSSAKHRKLLKAINADDFSGLSMFDTSIQELLHGTGVYAQMESSKEASQNNVSIVETSRTVVVDRSSKSEAYLKAIESRLAKMEKKTTPAIMDMGDYILVIHNENHKQKIWKTK